VSYRVFFGVTKCVGLTFFTPNQCYQRVLCPLAHLSMCFDHQWLGVARQIQYMDLAYGHHASYMGFGIVLRAESHIWTGVTPITPHRWVLALNGHQFANKPRG